MLRSGASHKYGGIIPSLGIDTSDSIIHLSYSGVGKDTALARFTSTASLKIILTILLGPHLMWMK